MKKILTSNGKALVDSTGKVLTFESNVKITRDNESIGLSGEYDGSPIEVTEAGKVDIKALIDEKKIPLEVNVNVASENTLKKLLDNTKKAKDLFNNYKGDNLNELIQYDDTENVTDFSYMYCTCNNATEFPALNTSNGTNFRYMYDGCYNATELPALDTSNGTDFRYMYNACKNARVIDISHYNISSTSNSRAWCSGCYLLKTVVIRSFGSSYVLDSDSFGGSCHLTGGYNSTHNPYSKKDGYVYVPRDMIETLSTATNWSQLQFRALEDYTKDGTTTGAINHKKIFMEESITFPESQMITETGIKTLSIKLKDFVNIPTVNITSDNEEVVTISNINATTSEITFDVNVLEVQGTANITVSISDDATIEETFTIGHYNYEEPTYSVENITDATYGFKLNSDEYYESTNKGVNNSYSLCKIVINNPNPDNITKMTLCCKHSSENNSDFGILSNIDTTLELSYSADSSNVYKSFKGIGSIIPMEISYALPNGEHFIYVKYIKDRSESTGYDSLQFKVMFGANI